MLILVSAAVLNDGSAEYYPKRLHSRKLRKSPSNKKMFDKKALDLTARYTFVAGNFIGGQFVGRVRAKDAFHVGSLASVPEPDFSSKSNSKQGRT